MQKGPETDARLAIDEHLDARALLAAVVDSTTDIIWSVDPERFALQFFNRGLREYFARWASLAVRPGMRPDELFPVAELVERWKGFYRRALAEGPFALEYQTSMGSLVLELQFTLLARDGTVFGITVFGRDVTARRRATDELRAHEEFSRALQDASPDLSTVIGPDGRLRFVSHAVTNVLGYTVEELLGLPPAAKTHPDDRARMAAALARLQRAEGHVERQRFRILNKDGEWRHLETIARNLGADSAVGGIVVNARDVTEQVGLATQLQHVREEEKARIARELHDRLGQLLTGLKLDLLWLEERLEALPATPMLGEMVERAVAAAELADRTIDEVQRLATELRPAALDRLGLGPALQQDGRRFQGRTGIPCRVEATEPFSDLPADVATALYRIFQEALTNVARHARASQVVVRLRTEDDSVVLTVDDDGVGVDPVARDVSRSLGVAGMRERAALEGGELTLLPRAEGGTRVEARLPRSAPRTVAP